MKTLKLISILSLLLVIASCSSKKESASSSNDASASSGVKMQPVKAEAAPAATTTEAAAAGIFAFEKTDHDFGQINQGDVVSHVFKYTNTGDAPLLISDIKVTCGCTTPNYTKEPVQPGESGEINVQFNSAGKSGVQTKRITILSNSDKKTDYLTIKSVVNVEKKLDGPFKQ